MGLLTVSLLEALPIVPDHFPIDGMFRPLFDAVRTTLREQPLLPTHAGNFVTATQAKLARGAGLLDLLTPHQLGELLESKEPLQWLSGEITDDLHRDLYRYL